MLTLLSVACAAGFLFVGGGTINRALGRGVAMYETDMGRYPVRRGRYTTPNDASGKTGFSDATIDTEILSMSLTEASTTNGSVTLPPAGTFVVDSFFDVFTELSIGGEQFIIDSFFDITYRITNSGQGKVPSDGSAPTGSWDTEMVSLSLSGAHPSFGNVIVQESPSKASLGQHTITPIDGTIFNVDSFFDIWTEVSIDGGPFVPADSALRVDLTSIVPEPGSGVALLLGLLGLVWSARRK